MWLNWRLLALIRGIFRNLLALSEEVLYTVTHFVWVTWLLTDCFMAMWGPLPRYRNKNYVDKRSGTTCLLELSIWDPKRCPYKWGRPLIIQLKKTKQKQRTFRSDQINKLVHFLLKIKGSIHWKSWKNPTEDDKSGWWQAQKVEGHREGFECSWMKVDEVHNLQNECCTVFNKALNKRLSL